MTETIQTTDGYELFLYQWLARDPLMTVALCHGYGEHAGRYEHVARAFNQRRISLVGADLRGHGRSVGRRGHVERFSDYLLDMDAIVAAARDRAPGGLAVLGHSMGGLVSCSWLLARGGEDLDGVVLTSPFLDLPRSNVGSSLISPLSAIVPRLRVDSGFSGRDLTHDTKMARAHDIDPLVNKRAVVGTIDKALETAEQVDREAGRLDRPTLLLYAGADRVASADATDHFARNLRMTDRTCERLPGLYHEILNEPPEVRLPLIERILTWLLDHSRHVDQPPREPAGSPS